MVTVWAWNSSTFVILFVEKNLLSFPVCLFLFRAPIKQEKPLGDREKGTGNRKDTKKLTRILYGPRAYLSLPCATLNSGNRDIKNPFYSLSPSFSLSSSLSLTLSLSSSLSLSLSLILSLSLAEMRVKNGEAHSIPVGTQGEREREKILEQTQKYAFKIHWIFSAAQ